MFPPYRFVLVVNLLGYVAQIQLSPNVIFQSLKNLRSIPWHANWLFLMAMCWFLICLSACFNGKNTTPPPWVMCTIIWLKKRPNILAWLILHGLGDYNDIGTISTFIPIKHTNNKHHMYYFKSTCQKNKTKASCYTKYGLGDLLLMGLWYPFARPTSCICSTPLGFPHHLIHLPRTRAHVHVVCKQFQWMPCLLPHASP